MPIYEYQCESCGHQLEAIQKMSAEPLRECPECKAQSLKKLVSAAAFKLKGGGWYETDFKSKNKKSSSGDASNSGATKAAGSADSGGKKADNASPKASSAE